MKDLKKYKTAIIGGVTAIVTLGITNTISPTPYFADISNYFVIFGLGAVVAFAIDKIWK